MNLPIDPPKGIRKGQHIFNFLEWLRVKGYAPTNQNMRMADPFNLTDEEWDKYLEEYEKGNQ